jgi:4'-phosphopantetheinyl transferase
VLPPDPAWPAAAAPPSLAVGEVHVWRVSLERPAGEVDRLAAALAPDEQARADRFRVERARREFVAARAALRGILGGYLAADPARLTFRLGPQGKPSLVDAGPALHFNLSHSHGLALVAVTCVGEVGVDVEQVRPLADMLPLAERYFAPAEVQILLALPAELQREAFFNAWTRKEAFLKAVGVGLSYGLDRVELTLAPGEPARFLRIEGDTGRAARWALHALAPAPGYVAALAREGRIPAVACIDWRG